MGLVVGDGSDGRVTDLVVGAVGDSERDGPRRGLDTIDRWQVVGIVVTVLAIVGWIVYVVGLRSWDMLDLTVYRGAGRAIRDGEALYQWRYLDWLPFTYTPFAGLLFAALSWLIDPAAKMLMGALDAASLVVCIWAVLHTASIGRAWTRVAAALVLALGATQLEPVAATISFGQVNLVLMALVVADLLLLDGKRSQGIGIGLAAAVKLTPAIFVPYLLLTGRKMSAVRATVTFLATVALSFLMLPGDSRTFWFDRIFLDSSRVGEVSYVANQSINGALLRWSGHPSTVATVVVAIWGVAVAVLVHRRGQPVLGMVVVACVGLLVSPVSWTHHWVWVVPAIAFFLAAAAKAPWRWAKLAVAVALGALFISPGWLWTPAHGDNFEMSRPPIEKLVADLYPIVGIAALVGLTTWLAVGAWRSRADDGDGDRAEGLDDDGAPSSYDPRHDVASLRRHALPHRP